ncbi:MAG: formylglycine-generating enzyme family protein [Bacteroidales bacterium]|nr:formylglycine-generating enzyme family protein [Bacteroidales bacterium]
MVTFEVEKRPGYRLDYVMIGNEKIERKMSQYSFTMSNSEIHIMAHFTKIGQYTNLVEDDQINTPSISQYRCMTFTVNGVSFDMIYVGGGSFLMGASSDQDHDAQNDEQLVHSVTLDSYYIGETEVTQALWQAVTGSNPSSFNKGGNYPVEKVSWNDIANVFLPKLNHLTGQNFRLPTEAEWEYAARGGNMSRGYKYSGSNNLNEVAWYGYYSDSSKRTVTTENTMPVKQKKPNELGVYDMLGNVWEWCLDWYGDYPLGSVKNPKGFEFGTARVLRGGSWGNIANRCRISNRYCGAPDSSSRSRGFRLFLSLQK